MNKKCQVFTPSDNVVELLDRVGYIRDLYGKKIIENACGDGNILKIAVERYIKDCISKNISHADIKLGLERDIYGAEIDKTHYLKCIENLNYVASQFKIYDVLWNILNVDILLHEMSIKFDYIIGNPPYITYRELDKKTRKYLKENYYSCSTGKFDYCYAFIELSLNSLSDVGKMVYLIPNSIFKNVYAQKIRDMLLAHIVEIYDYSTKKIFKNALTSSAVIVCDKSIISKQLTYYDIVTQNKYNIFKKSLQDKWMFLPQIKNSDKIRYRFGDYFNASISIATLLNEAFVIYNYQENNEYVDVNGIRVEKEILRKCASPKSLSIGRNGFIIYPYFYQEGRLARYDEKEFEQRFPGAVGHLKSYYKKLQKRNADKGSTWYEYGRSQALAHLNQEKLLMSTIITKEVKVYHLTEEYIPYSGIYIVPKSNMPLNKAKQILESEDFYQYVKNIGINANGTSIRITVKDINNYEFTEGK